MYRSVSEAECDSLKLTGKFPASQGSMETKWMATSMDDAQSSANSMEFGSNPKIVEITVPESALDNFYYPGPNLDNIGPAFSSEIDNLNSVVRSIK